MTLVLAGISAFDVMRRFFVGDAERSDRKPTESASSGDSDARRKPGKRRVATISDGNRTGSRYYVHMIDVSRRCALPVITDMPCWWCRAPFESMPLGAPIAYSPAPSDPADVERIKARLCEMNVADVAELDHFETEGIFCSFPCMKAYVEDEVRKGNIHFNDSLTLITLLYMKIVGKGRSSIPSAASWRVLTEWGGHLSIEQFRAKNPHFSYTDATFVRRPMMFASCAYIHERADALT